MEVKYKHAGKFHAKGTCGGQELGKHTPLVEFMAEIAGAKSGTEEELVEYISRAVMVLLTNYPSGNSFDEILLSITCLDTNSEEQH